MMGACSAGCMVMSERMREGQSKGVREKDEYIYI